MPSIRIAEDYLRSEYVRLLPAMQRTAIAVETEVRHLLLGLTLDLERFERVVVKTRLKDSESAIDALRRRQPYGLFDPDHAETYSLTALPDLVGVRVLVFPPRRLDEVRAALAPRLNGWMADPVAATARGSDLIALKYSGRWTDADPVRSEVQIVSMLVGLFWEVEHSAIYKPNPNLRGIARSMEMSQRIAAVETALREFEIEFQRIVDDASRVF